MQIPPLTALGVAAAEDGNAPAAQADVLISQNDVALVVQEGGEPGEAIAAALDEAGVDAGCLTQPVAVVEIPPADGASDGERMFLVLWGRVARSLHWLDGRPGESVSVVEADSLRSELMAGVLAAGSRALGMPEGDNEGAYPTLARWLAVANPSRAAWDALDRFFLARKPGT